jgi:hypothetical protein
MSILAAFRIIAEVIGWGMLAIAFKALVCDPVAFAVIDTFITYSAAELRPGYRWYHVVLHLPRILFEAWWCAITRGMPHKIHCGKWIYEPPYKLYQGFSDIGARKDYHP